jgi:hypothetical protein
MTFWDFSNDCKCFNIRGSSRSGRAAQLGEHLLCKKAGKITQVPHLVSLTRKRAVQSPFRTGLKLDRNFSGLAGAPSCVARCGFSSSQVLASG